MEIQEKKLRRLLKVALKEAIHEERDLFYDLLSEIVEDIGLSRAIDEGRRSRKVPKEEIYKILKAE